MKLAGHLSKPVTVNDGISQGSILVLPLLFIIFIADRPTHTTHTMLSVAIRTLPTFSTILLPLKKLNPKLPLKTPKPS